MPALTSGQSVTPRYTLVRRLGGGGMGEVWRVHDRQLGTEPAAKILVGAGENEVDLLRRECLLARRLNHPNIVRVFDFEQHGQVALMTMEAISGTDLSPWLGAPPQQIVELLSPVADALAYAHRQGIVHRDIKLSNILVDDVGSPHILDFGVAVAIAEDERQRAFGGGTPGTMSPQQRAGEPAQVADDLYGFGALLFELLTGRPPAAEVAAPSSPPGPPSLHAPHPLPAELRSLVAELLAAAPGDRPSDMEVVRLRLECLTDKTGPAPSAATADGQEPSAAGPLPPSAEGPHLVPPPRVDRLPGPSGVAITAGHADTGSPPAMAGSAESAMAGSSAAAATDPESRDRRLRYAAGAAFALLALAAITVFAVLPRWVANRSSTGDPPPTTTAHASPAAGSALAPSAPGGTAPAAEDAVPTPREIAAAARLEATNRRGELASRAASRWGGEAFAQALQELRRGEQLFVAQDYPAAAAAFREGTARLQSLAADSPRILQESLERGRRALSDADSATALEAFGLALAIDPSNAQAATGMRRAQALPQLLQLLDTGATRQHHGDLQGALEAYRHALTIEPGSAEARRAVERLSAQLDDSAFSQAMAQGLLALDSGDFAAARDAFTRAAAERPGAPAAADGLGRVESGLRNQAIAQHRRLADTAAAAEDWHSALKQYEQLLELDPTLAVAQQGRTLAAGRAELGDRLAAHLASPQRLATEAVRSDAETLLDSAAEVTAPGPILKQQIAALTAAITAYSSPLQVTLLSDGETTVEIYRVGLQGSFERRQIELLPGTYTVVGRRTGYQDVRLQLRIEPGKTPQPLTVRCEVKI